MKLSRRNFSSFSWARLLGLSFIAGSLLALPSIASAGETWELKHFEEKKPTIDGMLRDWPQGLTTLSHNQQGAPTPARVLLGYDENFLYVAADIEDAQIVRTGLSGSGQDRLSLDVYFPAPNGKAVKRSVDILPGQPGKFPAAVLSGGRAVAGAEAVEYPRTGGFQLEAKIPWRAFPDAERTRVGLRGNLTYTNVGPGGQVQGISRLSSAQAERLPRFTLAAEAGLLQSLVTPRNLGRRPAQEVYGNVSGSGEWEHIALYNNYLTITGPGYRDGKQFFYTELDIEAASQITRLELRDLTGEGHACIILQKRLGNSQNYREVLQVFRLDPEGIPQTLFAHEVALVTPTGRIENQVQFRGTGKNATLTISQGTHQGFHPDSFREPLVGAGIESVLLPWSTTKSRVYAWKAPRFSLREETNWKPTLQSSQSSSPPVNAPSVAAPPAPRPPTAEELSERVYQLYKQERGVGDAAPRFDFVTDVAEDTQPERILLHDRDLLVFGKGYKQGRGYSYLTLGVRESRDILSITSRDLTGDGKAEILVHAVIPAQAGGELGDQVVHRQALFVYQVQGDRLARIFAAETGRSLGSDRVLAAVAFLPQQGSVQLELRPLRAFGWSERSYPFPEDQTAQGGLEPLPLPWGTRGARQYVFDGEQYRPSSP